MVSLELLALRSSGDVRGIDPLEAVRETQAHTTVQRLGEDVPKDGLPATGLGKIPMYSISVKEAKGEEAYLQRMKGRL